VSNRKVEPFSKIKTINEAPFSSFSMQENKKKKRRRNMCVCVKQILEKLLFFKCLMKKLLLIFENVYVRGCV
jgi:hypothetical protein